jgi:tetratricopeptide (TPR) repeat protein
MTDPETRSLSDEALRAETAEVWQIEGQIPGLRESGQHALAAALGERLLELREEALGVSHDQTLEAAFALADTYYAMAQQDRAAALLDRVIGAREADPAHAPGPLGDALLRRAEVHLALGAHPPAEALARRALDVYRSMGEPGGDKVGIALYTLAFILSASRQEVAAREVRDEAEALVRGAPNARGAGALIYLAMLRVKAGDLDEAETLARRVLEHARDRGIPDHADTGYAHVVLSEVAEARGDLVGALDRMNEALRVRAESPGVDLTVADLTRTGELFLAAGVAGEASLCFRRAHELAAASRGADHPSVAHLIYLGGKVSLFMGNPKHALFCAERALAAAEKSMGTANVSVGVVLLLMADAQLALGKLGAAEATYRRMGALIAKRAGPTSEQHAMAPLMLGDVAMKRKDYVKAAELFEQALAIGERAYGGEDDHRLGTMLEKAGEAHLRSGALARAEALTQRFLAIGERDQVAPDAPGMLAAVRRLAAIYEKSGDPRADEMRRRGGAPEAAPRHVARGQRRRPS